MLHDLLNNITTINIYGFIENKSPTNIEWVDKKPELNDIINKAKEITEFEKNIMPLTNFSFLTNLFDNPTSIRLMRLGLIICVLVFTRIT